MDFAQGIWPLSQVDSTKASVANLGGLLGSNVNYSPRLVVIILQGSDRV